MPGVKLKDMQQKKFDVAVLGGGPGGYPAAIRAAQLGKSVALIEAKELGGTCLNRGCIPSKALIAGAEFLKYLKNAANFGVQISNTSFDFASLALHKDHVVQKMRKGLEGLIAANKISLFQGFGKFLSPREIKVLGQESTTIVADKIIIATGSEPRNLSTFPFDYQKIHDSTSLLALKTLPQSILIIGGGVIGCEFASLYSHLGVDVTILELLPRILSTEAQEVSQALTRSFIKRGIKVETCIKIQKIESQEDGITAFSEEAHLFKADCCLIAVGRSLNVNHIGLDQAGVLVSDNGLISVNDKMETTVDGFMLWEILCLSGG